MFHKNQQIFSNMDWKVNRINAKQHLLRNVNDIQNRFRLHVTGGQNSEFIVPKGKGVPSRHPS